MRIFVSFIVLPLHDAGSHAPRSAPRDARTPRHTDTRLPPGNRARPSVPQPESPRRSAYPGSPGRARGRRSAAERLRPSAATAAAAAIAPRPPTAPGPRGGSCPFPRWRLLGLTPRSPTVHGAQGRLCPFQRWRLRGFTFMASHCAGGTGKALPFLMMAAGGFTPWWEPAPPAPPRASPSHGGHEPGAAGGRGLGGAAGGQRRDHRDYQDHRDYWDHRDRPPPPRHPRYGPERERRGEGGGGQVTLRSGTEVPSAAGAEPVPCCDPVPVENYRVWVQNERERAGGCPSWRCNCPFTRPSMVTFTDSVLLLTGGHRSLSIVRRKIASC